MNLKPKLELSSLNVRGLNNQKKRKTIFQWLKSSHPGIVLLQETHSLEEDEKAWVSEWDNDIIFAHGTNNSRGVAILLDSKYEYIINKVDRDLQGRFIILNLSIDSVVFVIVNIYAPTKDDAYSQKVFYDELAKNLDAYIDCNIIIGGDFNVCLNPTLDKQGGIKEKQSLCAKQIETIAENLDLIDIWRALNENTKRFTWRSQTRKGRVSSRLDYWLISSHLCFDIQSTEIEPSIKTDHSLVSMTLALRESPERGRGTWKFNNSLLTDKDYVDRIIAFLETCDTKYISINNRAMMWDVLKCELRGITIEYSINKAREKRKYLNDLNTELKALEIRLDNNEDVKDTYISVRNEVEQIEEEKLRGNMVRSRAQWIEEGEKCSKYFMNLENRNYKTKCITTLGTDENKITDQTLILDECKNFYKNLYSEPIREKLFENCIFFTTKHETLNDLEKTICDQRVTVDECQESLFKFPNNKSPGSDGFTVEFYKFFWDKLISI